VREERIHNDEELAEMINKMKRVSDAFYRPAANSGNHAFIEFTGLMNEYIAVCQNTMAKGRDFTACNTHVGQPLIAEEYQIRYLAEKFDCIFGPMLSVEKNREIFFKAMGWVQ